MLHEEMNALSRDSDWRPLPPTPTSRHHRESKPKKQLCACSSCVTFFAKRKRPLRPASWALKCARKSAASQPLAIRRIKWRAVVVERNAACCPARFAQTHLLWTSNAWPLELEMMRETRDTCFMASSNKTRSIAALVSLYSFRAVFRSPLRASTPLIWS